ncbi:hypothetical protein [uncultured Thermomonospora sp.]|uniref:hypothetical protein n=1 Tax=uncultured Thermomonospora sp. TaxID=671175 RepID=UPI00259BE822|nr:hypothetical protein [uncultured Thermomonospora sp.]
MTIDVASAPVDLEALGDAVWDVLEAAGYIAAPEGSGLDGFDILKPSIGPRDHVAVIWRAEGTLAGMATPGVRRAEYSKLRSALASAGYATALYWQGETPVVLLAGEKQTAVDRALHHLRGGPCD